MKTKLPVIFLFLLLSLPSLAAERIVGQPCPTGGSAADWDTLAQCSSGTMIKAPLMLGAPTAANYTTTTCDGTKAGMLQWNGVNFQGCDGANWVTLTGGESSGTPACAPTGTAHVYSYTGSNQTLTVPADVTQITAKLWGGGGGGGRYTTGGGGGYAQALLYVTPGATLNIIVGGAGHNTGGAAGYGGGGAGATTTYLGGGGGGRSAIQSGHDDLVTAGGGGGYYGGSNGGGGGGLFGNPGLAYSGVAYSSNGGGPNNGGSTGTGGVAGGGRYIGGAGANSAGGGGGGFYGGGGGGNAGSYDGGGAGGGSGYARVYNASCLPTLITAAEQAAANNTDTDYAAGIGVGGGYQETTTPGNGLVVLYY